MPDLLLPTGSPAGSDCEWTPEADRPALSTDSPHGPAVASLRGYDGGIHLCADCAALPRFRRFKARALPTRTTP